MQYFPLFVDTQSLSVVIVGAGDVASRKLDLLCRTQAAIVVIAPEVSHEVQSYADQGRIVLHRRGVEPSDIQGIDLLYMATADEALNQHYAELAKEQGLWVNVVDSPALCRFITPSIVDRGKLVVAISTAGAAPVFARDLRAKLESLLAPSITPLFDFIASKRADVQQRLPIFKQRKLFWERFFDLNGERFDDKTLTVYEQCFLNINSSGTLWLLDEAISPQMLPIAVMPDLQKIDSVMHETGVNPSLQELLRRDAERLDYHQCTDLNKHLSQGDKVLVVAATSTIEQLSADHPDALLIQGGAIVQCQR
ncbi:bifunctional precorrin-2 dehydrogenase/sirohydrochlorin ferrochelatase [Shewanella waksmanii]|uniref:precorrin-2 dehydrogenase/sirohydrochlorin ferrochelatase family protein n=1 Tax=Shewanella waksmanii TaxID=213783 RepID=UPI003736E6CF